MRVATSENRPGSNVRHASDRALTEFQAARESVGRYSSFYNARRPYSLLDWQTPDQAYLDPAWPISVAAQPSGKST